MKSFLYGFCNVMGTRLELPYLGESGKYLLGELIAVGIFVVVLTFAVLALVNFLASF